MFWLFLGMFVVIAGGLVTIAVVIRMTSDGDVPGDGHDATPAAAPQLDGVSPDPGGQI